MDIIDINSESLRSMDTVVTRMRDFAKIIDSRSDFINSSNIKEIANAFNAFADWVEISNKLAVEQAVNNALDDFVLKLRDKLGV